MQNKRAQSSGPWWKFGHVWMVLAGPALVVVASFVTFYIAVTRPAPLVAEDYYRQGIDINKRTQGDKANAASLAPAIQARNHAATGMVPKTEASKKPQQ